MSSLISSKKLLRWFDTHQRDLPWRIKKTPYRVWISEIMLQQTQVATVIDYYKRFVRTFPTVKKLATADEADVLKLWEGLGYYRRARQLHSAAKLIVKNHDARFPTDFNDVLALPGIGRYTAGAILSISLDQRQPILEGNTIRLFARLLALRTDPRSSENQDRLWDFSERILPHQRIGDFNQALMEVGNQICTPKNPDCPQCPLMDHCPTFANNLQAVIPVASKKNKYEAISEAVVLVNRRGKYLVRRYEPGQRWAGLWDFPRYRLEGAANQPGDGQQPESNDGLFLQRRLREDFGLITELQTNQWRIKHAVTRFRITLECFEAVTVSGTLRKNGINCKWVSITEINDLAMSITGRKIAQLEKAKKLGERKK